METILINTDHRELIDRYAPDRDLGGFSNLSSNDLNKSSRLEYQYTGLYGELAWYLYRYGNLDKFKQITEQKRDTLTPLMKGDDGFDDEICHNGFTRLIDIKCTHVSDETQIKYLNLVVPPREYHEKMIYICGFTIGKDRKNVNKVVLAGWCPNEQLQEKWKIDPSKFAVKVPNLKNLSILKKIF